MLRNILLKKIADGTVHPNMTIFFILFYSKQKVVFTYRILQSHTGYFTLQVGHTQQ